YYFLYGHFDEAKARFEPLWKDHCGKDEYGYKAWQKLITIAARSLDVKESRRLAEAEEQHSCAVTAEQSKEAKELTGPVKIGDEKTLAKLEADKNPKYAERVKYLKQAYDTLSKSYVLFFNYRTAAETYDKISSINRFEEKDRREAARNALVLYSNMGDTAKMT